MSGVGIRGTDGDDSIKGSFFKDWLWGEDGNDTIVGISGGDRIYGGQGDDHIYGGGGNDTIHGEAGNDLIYGGSGRNILDGGSGNDTLHGKGDTNDFRGGAGDDLLIGGYSTDVFYGGSGSDTIIGGGGRNRYFVEYPDSLSPGDVFDGGHEKGYDILHVKGDGVFDLTPTGIPSRFIDIDQITVTEQASIILSLPDLMEGSRFASNLRLEFYNYSGGSNPAVTILMENLKDADLSRMGSESGDSEFISAFVLIEGSGANNTISSTGAKDRVFGYAGADELNGGRGQDLLKGGKGNDTLRGDQDRDTLYGQNGDDLLIGDNNYISQWARPIHRGDSLFGGHGNDTLEGGADNDTLRGAWGNDLLQGGHHNDKLFGNQGNDTLMGNTGEDELWGGQGADVFRFATGDGANRIRDFKLGLDRIELEADLWLGNLSAPAIHALSTIHDDHMTIEFRDGTTLRLDGITDATSLLNDITLI